jgi:asparagine synthase (glutamine-hydrolysing)
MLTAVTDQLRHRGPDGAGTWISSDGTAGLAHRRLAILDLSEAGRQPMGNRDGRIQVTFNGEIYNYRELRRELAGKGYRFRSQTDTEVLVHLYEEVGLKMIDRLDGDFAFGLWDDRRKRLLLARDRAGTKPLYYTRLGDRFLFASEIKALLAYPDVRREIDEESLYHYLTYMVVPPPHTLFQGIMKLPAAGLLVLDVDDDKFRIRIDRYWEPLPQPSRVADADLDERFRDLFARSVEKRLMSDVPVGVLFSGGVDSTLNAASFGRAIAPDRVRTFTVGVTGTRVFHDESDFAAEMARRLGTEHHQVRISERDLLASVQTIARQQDEPLADPVCVPLYFVTRLARQTGTIVLHAGEGADEIFYGYDKYQRFLRFHQRYWQPLSRVPSLLKRPLFALMRQARGTKWRKIADSVRRSACGQQFLLSSSVAYYETEKQRVLSRDFRHRWGNIDSFDVVKADYQRLADTRPDATFLQKLTYLELQLRLPELLLMRVDKMAMLNAVEVRVPFLDRDLIDFALSVPDSFKLRGGMGKEPVKRLAAESVPRELVYRRKSGFGAPILDWFRSRLGPVMRDQLHADRGVLANWFDVDELEQRVVGQPRTWNDAFQLWVVYNFMQWRRSFFEEPLAKAA